MLPEYDKSWQLSTVVWSSPRDRHVNLPHLDHIHLYNPFHVTSNIFNTKFYLPCSQLIISWKKVILLGHFVSYITLLTCEERRNFYTPSRRLVQFSVFEYLAPVGGCMETLAWLIKRNYTNEVLQQKKVSGLKFACHSIRQGVLRHSDRSPSFKGDVPETNLLHSPFRWKRVYRVLLPYDKLVKAISNST